MRLLLTAACILLSVTVSSAASQSIIANVLANRAEGSFRNLVESAEKMPASDYSFQATEETRTFAGFVGHTINSAYNNCSRAQGEANPNEVDLEEETSKSTLVQAAKAVQAYCSDVYASQTDASLTEMVTARNNQMPRVRLLLNIIAHNYNEYGQKVILMRLKNIVPPTTERAQQRRRQN